MAAAGTVTASLHLEGFSVTAIFINYVMQLLPLALVILFSFFYVKNLTKQLTELGELGGSLATGSEAVAVAASEAAAAAAGGFEDVKAGADSSGSSSSFKSEEGDVQVAISDAAIHHRQKAQENQPQQQKQVDV